MDGKERGLIEGECTCNIGKHSTGVLKVCWSRPKMFSKCRATDKIKISQNDIGRVGSCCTKPAEMWSSSEGAMFETEQQALVKELSLWECFSFRSGDLMLASGFQRLTELVKCTACVLIAANSISCCILFQQFPQVFSYRDCLLSLVFVGSQFQYWLSVTTELRKHFCFFLVPMYGRK